MTPRQVDYVVCDRCGHLWDIDTPDPDPTSCERCDHASLWRFPNERRSEAKQLALAIEETIGK